MRAFCFYLCVCLVSLLGCSKGEEFSITECPVILQSQSLPTSEEGASEQKKNGKVFSNREIRARYLCDVAQIGPNDQTLKAQGKSVEERARIAYETRKNARKTARAMMQDAAEVETLKKRDQEKYGNPDGPTFEWLVEKAKAKNLTGDAIFEEIIQSAQRTNTDVNKALGL